MPRYIHILGAIGLVVGIAMLPQVDPALGLSGQVLWVLIMPGLVYAAFIVFGGPRLAWERRHPPQIVGAQTPREIGLEVFEDIKRRYPTRDCPEFCV